MLFIFRRARRVAVSGMCDAECSTEQDIGTLCSQPCGPGRECRCQLAKPPVVCVRAPCLIPTCVTRT